MATRNVYLTYKYETSRIIYWILQTSNEIIKSLASNPVVDAGVDGDIDTPKEPNTSGQVTVAGLVGLAKLIGRHVDRTPAAILRLFRSVIDARTATHATFQQFVARNPDPEVLRSNASHKLFIDALTVAYDALGGDAALKSTAEARIGTSTQENLVDTKDDLDQLLLTNKFGKLDIQGGEDDGVESQEEATTATATTARRKQAKPGKGKKGKRPKKPKKTPMPKVEAEPLPLESYRIIQDPEGNVTNYLIAVYDLLQQMATLRSKMQEIWREVAYDGLNTAVAGAVSHIAVGMVQRTAAAMFVDFPGHDSFETVMNTVTRGNVEKSQGMFSVSLYQQPTASDSDYKGFIPGGPGIEKVVENHIDVKEQFLIHAYNDLLDFVLDFQKNRNGKPTKKMLAEIKDWNPNFDLERATNEERVNWRRSYTINWLYDLVNVFSSVVVQRNNVKKEGHVLEAVDWSPKGPWGMHRLIFGLQEFGGFVTGLAMQKPGTNIRNRILPHHVFQLQLIVDSLAVSRGWSVSALRGHIVVAPPRSFRPRRDVDLFLDRENKRTFHGFLNGAYVLEQLLEKEASEAWGRSAKQYTDVIELIRLNRLDFTDWLGESKYMYGLNTIPPSRFSSSNPNGLWEYSPMLCATGLTEALLLTYELGMWVWDRTPEITYLIHLHNMLHKRGFIRQPVGLFASIEDVFPECFYEGGKIPDSNFEQALFRHVTQAQLKSRSRQRGAVAVAETPGATVHELFGVELNMFFRAKSDLVVYNQANWDPDRIPDDDITLGSVLMGLRLSETKRTIDPSTGKPRLEETRLVQRVAEYDRQHNQPSTLLDTVAQGLPQPPGFGSQAPKIPETILRQIEADQPGYHVSSSLHDGGGGGKHGGGTKRTFQGLALTDDTFLEMLKLDLMRDVCGIRPLSSLNYIWVAARTKIIFMQIEQALRDGGYGIYHDSYEMHVPEMSTLIQKRYALVVNACTSNDGQALRAIAEVFENPRAGFMNHIYWEDLLENLELPRTKARREQEEILSSEPNMACSVM